MEEIKVDVPIAEEPVNSPKKRGRPPKEKITSNSQSVNETNVARDKPADIKPPAPKETPPPKEKNIGNCPFIEVKKEEIKVLTDLPQYRGPIEVKSLLYVNHVCNAPADGINGYCHMHSYPVQVPIAKRAEIKRKQWVNIAGKPEEIETSETMSFIYNVGEHIDSRLFTKKEIEDFYFFGKIGKRLGQSNVLIHKGKRHLDEGQVGFLLSENSAQEVASMIKLNNYDEETLELISAKTNHTTVKEAVRGTKG